MGWMVPMIVASAQKQQDEKLLAELIGKDKEDKYEFKILRGHLRTFRKPERLQAILEEERRSQWEMVIKLDEERIVLRRPRRSHAYDAVSESDTDPYRTQISSSLSRSKLLILLGLLVAGGLAFFMIASANNLEVSADITRWPIIAIAIIVGILMVFVLAVKRNR
ncbi:MAG: hypothetical protein MUQ30_03570 [Anaerolineae bacterium]|nr:hypothetical protein [Anaerolineae bacterium]